MADKTFIYALIDPEKNTVRYIGKSDNPWERLFGRHGHLHDKQKTYKVHWINSLTRRSLVPRLCILEECENIKSVWAKREIDWISFGRGLSWPLTNTLPGGEGGWPKEVSILSRVKARERFSGTKNPFYGKTHTEETKKMISAKKIGCAGHQKGKKLSDAAKFKISEANRGNKYCLGRKLSEATKLKIALAHTGRKNGSPSIETRMKMSAWQVGKKFSEETKRKISESKLGKKRRRK